MPVASSAAPLSLQPMSSEPNAFQTRDSQLRDGVAQPSTTNAIVWMLSGSLSGTDKSQTYSLMPPSVRVGRKPGSDLLLSHPTVSGQHARFDIRESELWLVELGSTNGTFVNGKRLLNEVQVKEDDLIQFAEVPFRVCRNHRRAAASTVHGNVSDQALALVQFDRFMEQRLVIPHFQPIIDLVSGGLLGYEVLARSKVIGLESCGAMFDVASRLNMEVELSRMLRWEGIREAISLPGSPRVFVNTHPLELQREGLLNSIIMARQLTAQTQLVLEIHEAAISDPKQMRELKENLRDLRVELAFDDFGAGQTRLAELTEARPDYLKFDISLIRGIDQAGAERQKLVHSLVGVTLDLGIVPLAEGVETESEAEVCRQLGFALAQGFHFGRPSPASSFC
jgi:EAL domain-containing protein (putative c-di-GMP-specific phosphodiesterase class I)